MKSMIPRRAAILLLPLPLAACLVGPDYKPSPPPTVARYQTQPTPDQTDFTPVLYGEAQAFKLGEALPSRWWEMYGSPWINDLVVQALEHSPTVAGAQATLRQAQENYRAQRGELFPSLDAKGNATRQKINVASFGDTQGGAVFYNLFSLSGNLQYVLDLWGGSRRALEQQAALERYQRYQLLNTYQTLAANTTLQALIVLGYEGLVRDQQMIVEQQKAIVDIVDKRYAIGAVGYSEVLNARANLATEKNAVYTYTLPALQARNQLAAYVGTPPGDFDPGNADISLFHLPIEIPLTLPSDLVRQRPDILAAEEQVHAAAAAIGVATADLLPKVTLNASFGNQATNVSNLFSGNVWSLGADLAQPLFRGGELTARRRASIAAYDAAVANYQQVVLEAFRQVATALDIVQSDATKMRNGNDAYVNAEKSYQLVEGRYRAGTASYLELLNAQSTRLHALIDFKSVGLFRFTDTLTLLQALGGTSWDAEPGKAPASDRPAAAATTTASLENQ